MAWLMLWARASMVPMRPETIRDMEREAPTEPMGSAGAWHIVLVVLGASDELESRCVRRVWALSLPVLVYRYSRSSARMRALGALPTIV